MESKAPGSLHLAINKLIEDGESLPFPCVGLIIRIHLRRDSNHFQTYGLARSYCNANSIKSPVVLYIKVLLVLNIQRRDWWLTPHTTY
jgi:hypothetical protein